MKNKIGIGVIGTNFISTAFCSAVRAVDGVEVVAVYSRKNDTGRDFAGKNGINVNYCSLADMNVYTPAQYPANWKIVI